MPKSSLAVALGALGILGSSLAFAAEPGMTEFRHPRHNFTLAYPQDWQPIAFRGGPDFHVLANSGKGPEDCNVNVAPVSGTDYLDRTNQARMLNTLRQVVRDAEFNEWRRQTQGRRWGVYYIVTGTLPAPIYKQTTLGYQVVVGSKLITLSCSAPAGLFAERRALFERILASLSF